MPEDKVVLLHKYCQYHHSMTWHVLCLSGVLQCLECYLVDRLDPFWHRIPVEPL